MVLVAGLVWHKELLGALIIAGAAGLAIRVGLDPAWWRFSWRALFGLVVVAGVATLLGLSIGIVGAVATRDWHVVPAPLQPAPGARPEILVSPCPSQGEQLSRRPDGSYVCSIPIPPDPGTGPVLASPKP